MTPLELARELGAIAQTGLAYTRDPYDRERYERLRELANGILADQSDASCEEIHRWRGQEFGYATPKVDVRAVIPRGEKGDEVLLAREDADGGRWTLPGGWADVNETPSQAVEREVEEECGYRVRATGLLSLYDREKQGHRPSYPYHVYKLFFLCRITGGEARSTLECSESAFFPANRLPEISTSRVLPGQIRKLCARAASGETSTLFD